VKRQIADIANQIIAIVFQDGKTGVGCHAVRALAEDGSVFMSISTNMLIIISRHPLDNVEEWIVWIFARLPTEVVPMILDVIHFLQYVGLECNDISSPFPHFK
jgi:hypothetical protein